MNRLSMWRWIRGTHPKIEDLLAHADGWLSPELDAHAASCKTCRIKIELLCSAIESAQRKTQSEQHAVRHLLGETFEDIEFRMRAWRLLGEVNSASLAATLHPTRSPKIKRALEFYFGKEVAERIDRCGSWNAADYRLVPATKPLFTAFLGRKAADALANRIAAAAS